MIATVLFRCDAGAQHGLGHLSRCLTLAAALAKYDVPSRFAINAPDSLLGRVVAEGHQAFRVDRPLGPTDNPSHWDVTGVGLVVLDSKAVNLNCVTACQAIAPVVCFDDEVARDFPCDVLINNHPWARLDDYGLRVGRKLLLGSRFNTVRQEFFSPPLMRNGLLITFGGEDPANHTTWLIEALASEIGRMPTVVVIGPAHPNTEAVQSACELLLPEAEIHLAPATLVPFAHLCHIAVSAAGTTCYELAASGIAMAVLAVEEHQSRIAEEMVSAGAALSLGRFGEIDKEMARRTYADLACPAIAEDLAAAGRTLFPAPGADAIADVLIDFLS